MYRKFSNILPLVLIAASFAAVSTASAADFTSPGGLSGLFGVSATSNAKSDPYPSTIAVGGLSGTITDVNVTLDVAADGGTSFVQYDLLLMAPDGTTSMLQSDCDTRGYIGSTSIRVSYDQSSSLQIPNDESPIVSSVNGSTIVQPRNCVGPPGELDVFPDLSPFTDTSADLSRFNGRAPNGEWKLYVGGVGPSGNFLPINGWTLHLTAADSAAPVFSNRAVSGRTIGFDLSEDATISYRVERASAGVRSGRKCKARKRTSRGRSCTRYKLLPGAITRTASSGVNVFAWDGKLAKKRLAPGKYRLTATATDAAGNRSSAAQFNVRISKAKKKR